MRLLVVEDEKHLNKIWGRFYRVDNVRNDEYGSSGLGLSMVKSIVELHGSEIFVKSELGKVQNSELFYMIEEWK